MKKTFEITFEGFAIVNTPDQFKITLCGLSIIINKN